LLETFRVAYIYILIDGLKLWKWFWKMWNILLTDSKTCI